MNALTRRSAIGGALALAAAVAGCAGSGSDGTSSPSESPGTTAAETDPETDLDLREANVTAVSLEDRGGGEYRFSVELFHDDDGEDGYADWWQVETLDGERLGRRELLHPHSTAPFTRSETVALPDDVGCVVVRGHDQTHGYGGQLMAASVPDGATAAVRQGPEPAAVDEGDCP